MPCKRCAWGNCVSDSRYMSKDSMQGVRFFRFPKPDISEDWNSNTISCREWIKRCNRPHIDLNLDIIYNDYMKDKRYYHVCSKHFKHGEPTDNSPYPYFACDNTCTPEACEHKETTNLGRGPPTDRSQKAVSKKAKKTKTSKNSAAKKLVTLFESASGSDNRPSDNQAESSQPSMEPTTTPVKVKLKRKLLTHAEGTAEKRAKIYDSVENTCDVTCPACKTSFCPTDMELKLIKRHHFIKEICKSNASCFQYTGFTSTDLLNSTFDWLHPTAKSVKLWDQKSNLSSRKRGRARNKKTLYMEFLLCLVRIRRGYDTNHLGYLFCISQTHASRIFATWLHILYVCFKPLLVWPTQELVRKNMPAPFKPYPITRIIIDATEFYVEKPFRPQAQRLTWSNYKHNNTFKLLVGIMPTGTISFVSKLYSGGISDLHIVQKVDLCPNWMKWMMRWQIGASIFAIFSFHENAL